MKSIILSAAEVRHARAEGKGVLRRKVDWTNSTVLGYPAKSYWPGLLFEHAEVRGDSLVLALVTGEYVPGRDVHLSVPYRAEGDEHLGIDELGRYRVRPKFEVGDRAWVKETWAGPFRSAHSQSEYRYRATDDANAIPFRGNWRPSGNMQMHQCRLTLEWTAITVAQADEWEWELHYKVAGGG